MKKYQKIILPIVIAVVIAGIAGFSVISQRHTDSHPKSGSPTEQSQEPTQPEKKEPPAEVPNEKQKTDEANKEEKNKADDPAANVSAGSKPAASSDKDKKTNTPKTNGGKKENKPDSSNKGNNTSKPTASKHEHKWVNITETQKVWVPKIETVEVWETQKVPKSGDIICNCGARFKNTDLEGHEQHAVDHILAGEPDNFWWETVWVDEKVKVKKEVDKGHYKNETHVIFTYCETCGEIK